MRAARLSFRRWVNRPVLLGSSFWRRAGLKHVELYGRVRYAVLVDGMSRRGAARVFGINRRTVEKMLSFSIPPGYRRDKEIRRPKLDGFTGDIDQILEADKLVPRKQRHTSKRIFEQLRDKHNFAGGITIVRATSSRPNSVSGRCSCHCRIRRPCSGGLW